MESSLTDHTRGR